MELVKYGEGALRQPPVPNAPTVEVVFGGLEGGSDVGLVRVRIPAGELRGEHPSLARAGRELSVRPAGRPGAERP